MQTFKDRNQPTSLPTVDPNGPHLQRMTRRYHHVNSIHKFRRIVRLWGLNKPAPGGSE